MDQEHVQETDQENVTPVAGTPGDALRSLPAEAASRGTRFISAQAMQARLFSVYDAAAAAEDALALVPDDLLESMSLCGPASYVAERVAAFKEAGVSHLQVIPVPTGDQTQIDIIAKVKDMIG